MALDTAVFPEPGEPCSTTTSTPSTDVNVTTASRALEVDD
jgi:hypothetical protein